MGVKATILGGLTALLAFAGLSGSAFAQFQTGNIYGKAIRPRP